MYNVPESGLLLGLLGTTMGWHLSRNKVVRWGHNIHNMPLVTNEQSESQRPPSGVLKTRADMGA